MKSERYNFSLRRCVINHLSTTSSIPELKKVPSCQFCGAKGFQYEPPTFCCYNGQVILESNLVSDELYKLYTSGYDDVVEFQSNIRAYNSIFSFTSFGVKLDKELATSNKGAFTFQTQGQIYYDLPSLTPSDNGPCFSQLYFYDTENEVQNRMSKVGDKKLNRGTMENLIKFLSINTYSQFFRNLKDLNSLEEYHICIKSDVKIDQRVYNAPSTDKVAAIWIEGSNGSGQEERDIVVHACSGSRHRVKHYYGCYDPLQYPLLFPKGEVGWHPNIPKKDSITRFGGHPLQNSTVWNFTSIKDIFNQEEGNKLFLLK
uniref:Uncharacterized protein n=1 Tax=Nelumbo nucifera TaxID=4432 RepID=A0A822YF63_NELNU|nr:TPA_asm: hypothetical protein HUJ06_011665 [Nelumbo nucifera]